MHWLKQFFSILSWLPRYKKEWLSGDLTAGITVGVMLIPQGMAYALIAGVPPVYGLYAAIIPQIIYGFFGTSRRISVGPAAMDSLLIASGVSVMAIEGTNVYLHLVLVLTFFVGLFQLILGILKLGFVTNLLSKPVISGFTSAAAIIIGINQLKYLLGIDLLKSNRIHEILLDLPSRIGSTHWVTLLIGIVCLLLIWGVRKLNKTIPASLIAVVLGIVVVYFGDLQNRGVSIVGEIPGGLPSFSFPELSLELFLKMAPLAMTLAIISYVETFSVGKSLETKSIDHQVSPNQELIALGLANLGGGLFSAFSVAGGFSRSAVNYKSGAKTPLSGIISATFVALVLLFFTSWFYYLPHVVLGTIIILAVSGLVDFEYTIKLFKTSKTEFLLLLATLLATLFFSLVIGIISGVIASIIYLLYNLAYPHIAELGKVNGYHEFRNVKRFDNLETWPDIVLLRVDAPLTFINISYFKESMERIVSENDNLNTIIIDAGPISYIDASASDGVANLLTYLHSREVDLLFCDLIGPVRDSLKRTRLNEVIKDENIFLDLNEAIKYATTMEQGDYKDYALQSN